MSFEKYYLPNGVCFLASRADPSQNEKVTTVFFSDKSHAFFFCCCSLMTGNFPLQLSKSYIARVQSLRVSSCLLQQ